MMLHSIPRVLFCLCVLALSAGAAAAAGAAETIVVEESPLAASLVPLQDLMQPEDLEAYALGEAQPEDLILTDGRTLAEYLAAQPPASLTLTCNKYSKSISGGTTLAGFDCPSGTGTRTGGGCTNAGLSNYLRSTLPNTSNGWTCAGDNITVVWVVCCS